MVKTNQAEAIQVIEGASEFALLNLERAEEVGTKAMEAYIAEHTKGGIPPTPVDTVALVEAAKRQKEVVANTWFHQRISGLHNDTSTTGLGIRAIIREQAKKRLTSDFAGEQPNGEALEFISVVNQDGEEIFSVDLPQGGFVIRDKHIWVYRADGKIPPPRAPGAIISRDMSKVLSVDVVRLEAYQGDLWQNPFLRLDGSTPLMGSIL